MRRMHRDKIAKAQETPLDSAGTSISNTPSASVVTLAKTSFTRLFSVSSSRVAVVCFARDISLYHLLKSLDEGEQWHLLPAGHRGHHAATYPYCLAINAFIVVGYPQSKNRCMNCSLLSVLD